MRSNRSCFMQFLFFFLTVRSDLFRGRSPTTEALVRAVQFEMSVDQLGSWSRQPQPAPIFSFLASQSATLHSLYFRLQLRRPWNVIVKERTAAHQHEGCNHSGSPSFARRLFKIVRPYNILGRAALGKVGANFRLLGILLVPRPMYQ